MSESATEVRLRRLANKVRLIEELWLRIQHVKWTLQSVGLLERMVKDLAEDVRRGAPRRLREVTAHFCRYLLRDDPTKRPLHGAERVRISALVDGLVQALPLSAGERPEAGVWEPGAGTSAGAEQQVAIISPDSDFSGTLGAELEEVGYRVRHYLTLDLAETELQRHPPGAIIAEIAMNGGQGVSFPGLNLLRHGIFPRPPVLFVSDRGDLAARMAAAREGGVGFFVRPLEVDLLMDRLRGALRGGMARGHRVLIVGEDPGTDETIAALLGAAGLGTRACKPLYLLQELYRFQPELIVVDMRAASEGRELVAVVRQHEAFCELPIVVLSQIASRDLQLALFDAGADDFLVKPLDDQLLLAALDNRLRRTAEMNRRLKVLSGQDAVAHLANRRRFLADLEKVLPNVGIGLDLLAVMLISIDNFRRLREKSGIAGCDRIMTQAGRRLRRTLRPGDTLARYGDSGFALMVIGQDEKGLRELARSLGNVLEERDFEVGARGVMVTISVGVSMADEGMVEPVRLVEQAELAAKLAHDDDSRIHIHSPRRDREARKVLDQHLLDAIKEALESKRVSLLFQPIVALGEGHTERYEVLLRLRDSAGNELLPESIFEVAGRYDLATAMDRLVISRTLDILAQRRAEGHQTELSVNVSPDSIRDQGFHRWLSERVRVQPADAEHLVFEMSEDAAVLNVRGARDFVGLSERIGCACSLERFGRSSEAEALLKRLPVRFVKLDNRLVIGLEAGGEKREELRATVQNIHRLGAEVVATGVENPGTLAVLWRSGVNYAQGYFLQEPFSEMGYDFASGSL